MGSQLASTTQPLATLNSDPNPNSDPNRSELDTSVKQTRDSSRRKLRYLITYQSFYQTNLATMDIFKKQETLKSYFEQSYGCAAFSSVAKGGVFFAGGAYGAGDIYKFVDGKEEHAGKVDLIQVVVGFVLGGEVYSEIVFFETEDDYTRFTSGNFEFSADAKAVALTAAVSANATTLGNQGIQMGLTADRTTVKGSNKLGTKPEYTNGMKVFTLTLGGLMYQATIGGQKFNIKE